MRACSALLRLVGLLIGIVGIIGGLFTFTSSTSANWSGLAIIASLIVAGLIVYGFAVALNALADIQEYTRESADSVRRSMLANERTAEALERLVIQRRRPQAALVETVLPQKKT